MNDEEIQRNFLDDMLDRKKRGETPLMIPQQYADVFGVPIRVAESNLEYMAQKSWINARVEDTVNGRFIFIHGINRIGIDHLDGTKTALPATPSRTGYKFQGVKDSLIAMGGQNIQTQPSSIRSFQELYSYLDRNLNSEQVSALKTLLTQVEVEIRDESVKPATLKKITVLATQYGPPAAAVIDFMIRQLGLKN